MKVFAALVFFLGYSLAQAQTGPIHTPQINTTYYVGAVSGFYPTIQSAVTKACSANAATVDIPAGSTPGDTIASVTGGCSTVAIVDERGGSGFSNYAWNGTNYVIVPIASAVGGNYSIQYANGLALAGANFTGPVYNNGSSSPPTAETQAQARALLALGSAAFADIGTSGATVPLLNGANTYSGINRFGTNVIVFNPMPATSSNNFPSPPSEVCGNVWDGTSSQQECWNFVQQPSTGVNPLSTLAITHTGPSSIPGKGLISFDSSVTAPSYAGIGTATFTLGSSTFVGSGATTPTCSSGICDSLSGVVTFTSGTGATAAGTALTINLPVPITVGGACLASISNGVGLPQTTCALVGGTALININGPLPDNVQVNFSYAVFGR